MNATISYNTIIGILANPPSLDPHPNFFNLRALRTHFARALKKLPCPQSGVNGWAGAVLAPAMYALIDNLVFHWNISTTPVPKFPAGYTVTNDGSQGARIPYTRKEILTITAKHTCAKHYHDTGTNVCHTCFDILDAHISNAYKIAPASSPNTVGWNSTMLPNEIINQLMTTYGKLIPDAVRQNNLTFIATYNPKDPPELLFKHVPNCQEVVIVTKVPYTMEQLLMNIVNLFTHFGVYVRNMDDWERKPLANQTYFNLRPFIQAAYQCRLASGVITATTSGYASNNCFTGLTAEDNVSDDGTANTIVKSINTHMANLSASILLQSNTSNNGNTVIFNASMQQVAANEAQRNNNHNCMLQQFAKMTKNQPGTQNFASQFFPAPGCNSVQLCPCSNPNASPGSTMGPTSRRRRLRRQPLPQQMWPSPPAWSGATGSTGPLHRWESDDSLHPGRHLACPAAESLVFECG
jgi:hypothetical protein